jgi:PAS domain S-box-containing protein
MAGDQSDRNNCMGGAELRLFIEQAPMAVAMFDCDMRYVAVSARWLQERGEDASIIGRCAYDVHPEISPAWRALHRRALAGETLSCDEDRLTRPHGQVDWVRWEIRPWRDPTGEIGGLFIYAENITARKQAEQALKASSERLQLAQSVAHIGIWDWDLQTGAAWVNEEYHLLCDLPAGTTATYEGFLAQVAPEDRDAYAAAMTRALSKGGEIDAECRIRGAQDGALRWLRSKGKIFLDGDGRPIRGMGALWDITALKRAQAALLEKSEARYRRIVETSLEGIWLIDAQEKTLFVNPRMADMLGRAPDDMIGRPVTDFVDGDWRTVAQPNMHALASTPAPPQEFKFRRADGSEIWVLLGCRPIFEDEAYVGSLAMVMDFTERKALQDKVQANIRQLKESDRRKNEFLATLAHELRNPLATISLAVEKLEARLQPGVPAALEDQQALARVLRQAKHLSRLVDELVQVSRITSGKIALQREVCDLVALIPEAVSLAQPKIEEKGVALVLSLPREPLLVLADPVRLVQVFGNLLDNATKFTNSGGRIEVTLVAAPGAAIVTVRDDGVGLAPEELSGAFELFRQMRHGRERNAEGLGIGLALARQLVDLHGGEIVARSEGVGHGSAFIVRLPLQAEPATP